MNQTTSLDWSTAARTNLCDALNLNNPLYPTTLMRYLAFKPCTNTSSLYKRAPTPRTLNIFWSQLLKTIQENKWEYTLRFILSKKGPPKQMVSINNLNSKTNVITQIPEVTKSIIEACSLFTTRESIWTLCFIPLVPSCVQINTWKVLLHIYRTADRYSHNHPLCSLCDAQDTIIHRFFRCKLVSPIWNRIYNCLSCYPLTNTLSINWFVIKDSNILNRALYSFFFNIGLWSAHLTFLDFHNVGLFCPSKAIKRLEKNLSLAASASIFNQQWNRSTKKIVSVTPFNKYFSIDHELKKATILPTGPPYRTPLRPHPP